MRFDLFHGAFMELQCDFYVASMVLLWDSRGATVPWYFHGASMVGGVCAPNSSVCCCHLTSMVLPWYTHGGSMVISWCSHGASMGLPWCVHVIFIVFPWCFHGCKLPWGFHDNAHASIASMWDLRGAFMDFHGPSMGLPRCFYVWCFYDGASMVPPLCFHGPPWCSHGASMVTSWYLHGVYGASMVLSRKFRKKASNVRGWYEQ